jgi:hypothetical protein
VALVVGSRVLVDLDEDDLRVVEMVLHPLGGDESGVAAHWFTFLYAGSRRGVWSARGRALEEEVDLAAEAEADRVEQSGRQGQAGGDQCEEREAGGETDEPDQREAEPDPLREARRPWVLELVRCPEPRPDEGPEQPGVRRVLDAADRPDAEDDRMQREQVTASGSA